MQDWTWTPGRVYTRLNLDDPDHFARRARDARHARLCDGVSAEVLAAECERCTGRTTRILAEAVAHAMNGQQVLLVGGTVDACEDLVDRARGMLYGLTPAGERGLPWWAERAERIQATRPASELPPASTVVLYDHDVL